MRSLAHRLSSYAREMWFAFRLTPSVRDGLRLINKTLQFHLHNAGRSIDNSSFDVRIRLGHKIVPLRLRPAVGDLFVLYEVLMGECYYIPSAMCDPESVKTIVDCGANVGITSLYLAARYPAARIYAIEPLAANYELLCHNTREVSQITPIHACVTPREGPPVYFTTDRPAWGNRISQSGAGVLTEAITVEALCRRHSLAAIDLLKVDIEGGEKDLFSEPGFLKGVKLIVIELHPGYDLASFRRDLQPWGLEVRSPGPDLGTKMITASRRLPDVA
jgi:FkbM family methyltransferase